MTTKQSIEYGENLLREQRITLERIELLKESKDDKKTLEFLLEYLRLDIAGRIADSERRIVGLKRQYEVEFEKNSYVVNSELDGLISDVEGWIGKEPVSVTEKIAMVVEAYHREKAQMSQEQRNEIYFELKRHYDFLTKVYNPRG